MAILLRVPEGTVESGLKPKSPATQCILVLVVLPVQNDKNRKGFIINEYRGLQDLSPTQVHYNVYDFDSATKILWLELGMWGRKDNPNKSSKKSLKAHRPTQTTTSYPNIHVPHRHAFCQWRTQVNNLHVLFFLYYIFMVTWLSNSFLNSMGAGLYISWWCHYLTQLCYFASACS